MVFIINPAVIGAIISIVSTMGPAVAGFCTNVLPKIIPILEKGFEILQKVASVANIISQVFGIFKKDETVEDMGDRGVQAAEKGITPDQFDDHESYLNKLRDFELDPKRSEEMSPIQKIVSGLALAGRGLDEKFGTPEGTMGNLFVLAGVNPEYFNADKLGAFLRTGQDIMSVVDYFEGKLGAGEALEVEDKLVALDKETAPEQDEKSIRSEMYAAAAAVQASGV
jgi:hypothetical protein